MICWSHGASLREGLLTDFSCSLREITSVQCRSLPRQLRPIRAPLHYIIQVTGHLVSGQFSLPAEATVILRVGLLVDVLGQADSSFMPGGGLVRPLRIQVSINILFSSKQINLICLHAESERSQTVACVVNQALICVVASSVDSRRLECESVGRVRKLNVPIRLIAWRAFAGAVLFEARKDDRLGIGWSNAFEADLA